MHHCDFIIVSTWKSDFTQQFKVMVENSRVKVVLNEDLIIDLGTNNVNKQIISTKSGIDLAIAESSTHILKLRSDQVLFSANFMDEILSHYFSKYNQPCEQKLLALTNNSFVNRIYSISDFCQFGTAEMVRSYWDTNFQSEKNSEIDFVPEAFLFANFLTKQGHSPNYTLTDYYKYIAKYIILIEPWSLGYYWSKYTFQVNYWVTRPETVLEEFTYAKWVKIVDSFRD